MSKSPPRTYWEPGTGNTWQILSVDLSKTSHLFSEFLKTSPARFFAACTAEAESWERSWTRLQNSRLGWHHCLRPFRFFLSIMFTYALQEKWLVKQDPQFCAGIQPQTSALAQIKKFLSLPLTPGSLLAVRSFKLLHCSPIRLV